MSGKPEGYVEVHERIEAFYEKYPEGSLQGGYEIQEVGGETFVIYRAEAFKTAEDQRPGIGYASEPFPGKTSFTKDSELMNAETSAWGRALAALGFKVKEGIASGNEVRARTGGEIPKGFASDKQRKFFEGKLKRLGVDDFGAERISEYLASRPKPDVKEAIDTVAGEGDGTPEEMRERLEVAANLYAEKTAAEVNGTEGFDAPAGEDSPV